MNQDRLSGMCDSARQSSVDLLDWIQRLASYGIAPDVGSIHKATLHHQGELGCVLHVLTG